MATMKDILALVQPLNHKQQLSLASIEDFEYELQTNTCFNWSEEFGQRMLCAPVRTWMCTDTLVGVFAYYFDGQFVALSFQPARKSDKEFRWVNQECANYVRNYILELWKKEKTFSIECIDENESIGSLWMEKGK